MISQAVSRECYSAYKVGIHIHETGLNIHLNTHIKDIKILYTCIQICKAVQSFWGVEISAVNAEPPKKSA